MSRYYTRVCNFYYGNLSKILVKEKKALPLNGNNQISFDQVELISRKSKKKISIKKINKLPRLLKKQITHDLKKPLTNIKVIKNSEATHTIEGPVGVSKM